MSRKSVSFLLLFVSLATLALAAPAGRNSWGTSESGLRAQENRPFQEQVVDPGLKALFRNDQIAGLNAFVIYLLAQDQLVQTKYLFAQEHLKPELFLEEYEKVERILRQQYGQPVESGEFWQNGAMRIAGDPGRMIAVGELVLLSRWETEDTIITHVLQGESLDIDHEINYISKELGKAGAPALQPEIARKFRF